MKAYLKTRGTSRQLDYAFLGAAPAVLWWTSFEERGLVILEQPEVIAHGGNGVLHLLVSGIPSERRDIIGTRIRYTLVLADLQDDLDLALRLAATTLSEDGRARLGGELDRVFDAARVDGQLTDHADDAGVDAAVTEVLASPGWAGETPADRTAIDGTWAGPVADETACSAFLARIADLAADQPGYAFTTHTLTTPESIEEAAPSLPGPSAIVVIDGQLGEVVRLGKKALKPAKRRLGCLLTTSTAMIVSLILALLLFG